MAKELSLKTVERVKHCLMLAGYATGESLEAFSADIENQVLNLCRYVEGKAIKSSEGVLAIKLKPIVFDWFQDGENNEHPIWKVKCLGHTGKI